MNFFPQIILAGIIILKFRSLYVNSTPWDMLWLCNFSVILLLLGFLIQNLSIIAISSIAILTGLPFWLSVTIVYHTFEPSAFLVHVISPIVGGFAIRRTFLSTRIIGYAFIYGILLQVLSRLFAPRELNINAAFEAYGFFSNFVSDHVWFLVISNIIFLVQIFAWFLVFRVVYRIKM